MESMIHKFLNATTFDGYNPYRVTKSGFDWEIVEEHDPWSYIGYWGDHQIIYLLKFLEFSEDHYPNQLSSYFDKEVFVYANVPYKIKSYQEIINNPKDTIVFDGKLDALIRQQRIELGADAALIHDKNTSIYKVNLIEKLLATVLAKLSNYVPEGGIWLNTQRPEWNDANNALVGNGVSMVTLYYLNRFLKFFKKSVSSTAFKSVAISEELEEFFNSVKSVFTNYETAIANKISNAQRKTIMDGLGEAGSTYRLKIYKTGFVSNKKTISKEDLLEFFDVTLKHISETIKSNKRSDNLYHAYNLLTIESDSDVSIAYLTEMLEGQVAVLSSGYLSSKEALDVLDGMKKSALFREDQYSYILYPNKDLGRFSAKNNIPHHYVEQSKLLQQLVKDGNKQIIEKDILGDYHFNGNFNNANSLRDALSNLSEEAYGSLVKTDTALLFEAFEAIFDHKSFTGRSGTFFGYEGLGSIYWHMVSKLLVAVKENCVKAIEDQESDELIGKLLEHYYEINAGIGVHKAPELYGAFPTDPYSHTPAGKGAQQPGMTGQVKEDILSRFGELGVFVKDGKLGFNSRLLRSNEFIKEPQTFQYITINGQEKSLQLEKDTLCFTYCQIPIIYQLSDRSGLTVAFEDNSKLQFENNVLDRETSLKMFKRKGDINYIKVAVQK